jgi:hypothetical protein
MTHAARNLQPCRVVAVAAPFPPHTRSGKKNAKVVESGDGKSLPARTATTWKAGVATRAGAAEGARSRSPAKELVRLVVMFRRPAILLRTVSYARETATRSSGVSAARRKIR